MGLYVYSGAPSVNPPYVTWGGACNQYYGFQIFAYDTDRPRPGGSDDPTSKYYKYYPAEGAIVKYRFYDPESGWECKGEKRIPENQPKWETIAWVYVGCTIPCSICGNRKSFYVNCDVTVYYKGNTWSKTYEKILYISCPPKPGETNPYYITVESDNINYSNGVVSTDMWLSNCETNSFRVRVGLYGKINTGAYAKYKYKLLKEELITLYKNRKTKITFVVPKINGLNYVGIAIRKPGTEVVEDEWVCGKKWTIRL